MDFKETFFTEDDAYFINVKYLLTEEEAADPVKAVQDLRLAIARAAAAGVTGTYELPSIHIQGEVISAEAFLTPGQIIRIGDRMPEVSIAEDARRIEWFHRQKADTTEVSLGYVNENLRRHPVNHSDGELLRFGILLGLQIADDRLLGRIGAIDGYQLKATLLADLKLCSSDMS